MITKQRPNGQKTQTKPTEAIAEESTAIAQRGGNLNKAPPPNEFLSSGEKTKARDIITAVRTLKALENEGRAATAEEKQLLGRFSGFGPVALSIFPDPITGKYKDAGWQALGEELRSLLTSVEYDSAKRTTYNAFYTSPTVINSIHEAIGQLGVPEKATILEPGCGSGNFLSLASPDCPVHRDRDGFNFRANRPARHPEHDIRIENFRDTRLPENRIDAVVGNVPFADVKLDHNGQKYLAPRLLLRQVDRRLEAGRSARAGDLAFHARQAKRRDPRVSRLQGRLCRGHSVAVGCLQTRRNRRGDRHRLSSQA